MRRREALEVLGLGPEADLGAIKTRFRALAHDHHPDRGGDAERFAMIRAAYRALTEQPSQGSRVARGTPSRPSTADRTATLASDAERVAAVVPLTPTELASLLGPRPPVLDGLMLARLLVTSQGATRAGRAGAERHIRLLGTSPRAGLLRGPARASLGSRTSVLDLLVPPNAGPAVAAGPSASRAFQVRLRSDARVVRRRLTALDLDPARLGIAWHRQRGDRTTQLEAQFPLRAADSVPAAALWLGDAVSHLLEALVWPLADWTLAPGTRRASALAPATDLPPA
jgi:hypothetical protein